MLEDHPLMGAVLTGCWWWVDGATSGDRWRDAVVQVRATRCGGAEIRGSGVVVDGHVLTNVHVVSGASDVVVVTRDGRRLPVRSVATSSRVDLASMVAAGTTVASA